MLGLSSTCCLVSATDSSRASWSAPVTADGCSSTLREVSQVPVSTTTQRTFQRVSSNSRSATVPMPPSRAAMA